ncbi:hypothetical protein BRD56_10770 [Thermoplasmatales archaeon SW_10_69_26]|nr:MAG: hypothetical protein BRD56_10770 [Thermoplasmatales archaeon SW_10_69_26]
MRPRTAKPGKRRTTSSRAYDREHDQQLVLRGLASLLMPTGWDEDRLEDRFARAEEPTLWAFA